MEVIRQMVAIGVVFALLAAVLWGQRQRNRGTFRAPALFRRPPRRLETVERLPLTAHHSLHLVRAGPWSLLLAVHPGGCSVIDRRPWSQSEEVRSCEHAA